MLPNYVIVFILIFEDNWENARRDLKGLRVERKTNLA